MSVNKIGMEPQNNIKTAVSAGLLSAGLQAAILPKEIKSACKNAILGQDSFIKRTQNAAIKEIEILKKAGKEEMAAQINVKEAIDNAKAMYPAIVETSKTALKAIGQTFVAVSAGVLVGKAISDLILSKDNK
ncbi:hypothetical protein IJ182_00375 [bacterium]|nr:hypothetical protein [bacterium]